MQIGFKNVFNLNPHYSRAVSYTGNVILILQNIEPVFKIYVMF